MTIIEKIQAYLLDYVALEDNRISLPLALWSVGTHMFERFDAFPYLVITSLTKRSGKTRLSELLSFVCCNSQNFSAMTPSTLFRVIDPKDSGYYGRSDESRKKPTIVFDEAEILSSESASVMRAVLNVGYRKGQTVPRTVGNQVVHFNTYCPKIFILIGDVYDTLRDRSIMILMKRGEPRKRFAWETTSKEATELKLNAQLALQGSEEAIVKAYHEDEVSFLSDREEEIWRPILAVCKVLLPGKYRELQRLAVDLSAEKTAEKRRYVTLDMFDTEAESDEYARKLLKDLHAVFYDERSPQHVKESLFSEEAITRLMSLDLAPWRKFRGTGLTVNSLADLLSRFGVRPVIVRRGKVVQRGYKRKEVEAALAKL